MRAISPVPWWGGAALVAATAATAAPEEFRIDPDHTHVHWEIRHFGTSTIRGRFDSIVGGVTLDRVAHNGSASFTIDTTKVSTGFGPFDGVVRGSNVLASESNPSAYFVANRFAFDGDKLASVTGELTLRGASHGLTLTALRFACHPEANPAREICGGDFRGEFDRGTYGISYAAPFVSNTVRVVIEIEAHRLLVSP